MGVLLGAKQDKSYDWCCAGFVQRSRRFGNAADCPKRLGKSNALMMLPFYVRDEPHTHKHTH